MNKQENKTLDMGVKEKETEKGATLKKCFIITPIGSDNSDIRRKADGVRVSVIEPLLKEKGFTDVKAAHGISSSGNINNQIVQRIVEDDLVIVNLTGLNPNVMYELAIRHATKKPVIHICEEGTNLPFDIVAQRCIFYRNDLMGAKELENSLRNHIEFVDFSENNSDNPIYNAINRMELLDKSEVEDKKVNSYILDLLEKIYSKISSNNNASNKCNETLKEVTRRVDEIEYCEIRLTNQKGLIEKHEIKNITKEIVMMNFGVVRILDRKVGESNGHILKLEYMKGSDIFKIVSQLRNQFTDIKFEI